MTYPAGMTVVIASSLAGGVLTAVLSGATMLVCVGVIRRIVRSVRRGKRAVPGLYLSMRQANRRITQLVLLIYAVTVFPVWRFVPAESIKSHMLALTLYLVTVLLAVVWLAVMALFDLREIRRASRGVTDETSRRISDEMEDESSGVHRN